MKHVYNFLIGAGCVAAIAVLNFVAAGLTNGSIQLPDPALTTTVAGLVVAELVKYLTGYEQAHSISQPQ